MKKIALVMSLALVAMAVGSCGKTTKGKLEGEWKMDAFNQTSTSTFAGSTSTTTTAFTGGDGGTITITSTGSSVQTGTVAAPIWTIMKDGSWTRSMTTTYSTTMLGVTTDVVTSMTESGSWDFLKGINDSYKKNERVVFNTLALTTTETVTIGGTQFSTDTDTYTYTEADVASIYVVNESKKKTLDFTQDGGSTWANGSSTSSETSTGSFTLSQD